MVGIYKITNKINNNCYIGQSVDIEKRWAQHISKYSWEKYKNNPLYLAFQKYGLENFSFEVVEECEAGELNSKEQYWISYYDSYKNGYNQTSGGETLYGNNHPRHKLTEDEVRDIRMRYANLERKREVYKLYSEKIGEAGFSAIWKGQDWQQIMPEVYTEATKKCHKHDTGLVGSQNPSAKLTEQDIRDIRIRYGNLERRRDVYQIYSEKIDERGFIQIWTGQTWKHIMPEVFTQEAREWHKHHNGSAGSQNGNAKLAEQDIIDIRLRRKNREKLSIVYEDYKDKISESYFKDIWYYKGWSHIAV